MQAQMNEALAKDQLVSELVLEQSQVDAEHARRPQPDREGSARRARPSRCARSSPCSSRWSIRRARFLQLTQQQRDELKVRAGLDGMLQLVPVEVGQQVAPGTNLARVANPSRLKAEIKIAETQAKDIQLGQKAEVDTRNGIVEGRVAPHRSVGAERHAHGGRHAHRRPAEGRGARPERRRHHRARTAERRAVHGPPGVRPGPERRRALQDRPDGVNAERVQVKLGRSSVNTIEVLSGLKVGDQVILSDMSAYDAYDRIRLK